MKFEPGDLVLVDGGWIATCENGRWVDYRALGASSWIEMPIDTPCIVIEPESSDEVINEDILLLGKGMFFFARKNNVIAIEHAEDDI